jgi:hypothetical protein
MLFQAYHEATSVKDNDGLLPLHHTVGNNATLEVTNIYCSAV